MRASGDAALVKYSRKFDKCTLSPRRLRASAAELPSVRKIAAELDEKGFNVSRTGGHLMDLRRAMEARRDAGRPLLGELNGAMGALTLEEVANTHAAIGLK